MGGRLGIHGFQSETFANRFFPFGHSGYFAEYDVDPDRFMREWWLPLLLEDRAVAAGPPRPESPPPIERFWRTVGENGGPATALFYGLLVSVIAGSIMAFWLEARQERLAKIEGEITAQSAVTLRLLESGRVEEAAIVMKKAILAAGGNELQKNYPDALSALRTLNSEFPLITTIDFTSRPIESAHINKSKSRMLVITRDRGLELWSLDNILEPTLQKSYWNKKDFEEGNFGRIVTDAKFSRDGEKFIAAWADGSVSVYKSSDGEDAGAALPSLTNVSAMKLTKDGLSIVLGTENGILSIASLKDGEIRELARRPAKIELVDVSDDGRFIAASFSDHSVGVIDADNVGGPIYLTSSEMSVSSLEFDKYSNFLATGSIDGTTRLLAIDGRSELLKIENSFGHAAIVGPAGTYIATGPYKFLRDVNQPVHVWLSKTGSGAASLVHEDGIRLMVFNPVVNSNQIATASKHEIRIWSPWYGRLERVFRTGSSTGEIEFIDFSPDGSTLVSVHREDAIKLWDVRKRPIGGIIGSQDVAEPVFLSNQEVLTVSDGGSIQKYEFPSLSLIEESRGDWRAVDKMAVQSDGSIFVAQDHFSQSNVQVWSVGNGNAVSNCYISGKVQSIALDSGGRMAIGGDIDHRVIRICDVDSQKIIADLIGEIDFVSTLEFSPDRRYLASGDLNKLVTVWDIDSRSPIFTLTGHEDQVVGLAFSSDGSMLASGSLDRTARIWDLKTGELKFVLEHDDTVRTLKFNPAGTLLATYVAGVVNLWDPVNGRQSGSFRGHRGQGGRLAFSPDGRYLLSSSDDDTVRRWEVFDEVTLKNWIIGVE